MILNSRWAWFVKGLPDFARARAMFRIKRYTMTSPTRCRTLWDQCSELIRKQVPGCFVECGVWRGGSAGLMGLAMRHLGEQRPLHLFDSFEGLPEPTAIDEAEAKIYSGNRASGKLASVGQCQAGLPEVERFLFDFLNLNRNQVKLHVGWFQNTLPTDAPKLGKIALLRLDGDWYESTMVCLNHLYPQLSPGGIVILDDYHAWAGCKKATDEYRQQHGITTPMHRIDDVAFYWIKE
jgi:O-methyltransferase